ncbi:MAG: hypothetical protein E7052_01420 [Lentisphaerae bacterium]|nr:hypothetical protein [Lentisphaerota bacterium]
MLNVNGHKNFTAGGDPEAEKLLGQLLNDLSSELALCGLSVYLGGSYGRGEGGVRSDRENGILYNDLDFFVFGRKKPPQAAGKLKDLAWKYEKIAQVDVDFSSIMTVGDIKNNARRLMMQELKRGHRLVCGEDLLAEYLPEYPAEELPFSEACRLLFNRGMGLLMARKKISENSGDIDFILRNICKAILGVTDAVAMASGQYKWKIAERLSWVDSSDLPEGWKKLYRQAVAFKQAPRREAAADLSVLSAEAGDFFRQGILRCAGAAQPGELAEKLYFCSRKAGETSLKNYAKYCVKTRSVVLHDWRKYTLPAVSNILPDLYEALQAEPEKFDWQGKLYRHWLIFN